MDSPALLNDSGEERLRVSDSLLLIAFCALLYGSTLLIPRILTSHETTHCLNVREMMESRQWLIPTYGGRPWLERPPAPHWLTAAGVALAGNVAPEISYRLGSIFIATLAVLVFAWSIAGCMGRNYGMASGAVLATMQEFFAYAVGPEADIFLASTVTIAGSLLIRIIFDPIFRETSTTFAGGRSWATIGFFVLLGAMNAMKGPLFGMFFIVLPIGASFLWTRTLSEVRPLIWLWGWLLTLALGVAWPVVAYLHYPDITDLWAIDYGVRWRAGYLGEPFWYYLVQQPWNIFPWTVPFFLGLAGTAGIVMRGRSPVMRFLWCWALVPVLFFSLFKGKHHHYMLGCLAPAAAIAVHGAYQFWRWFQTRPNWLRQPWLAVPLLGAPGSIAIYLLQAKIPGPAWLIVAGMIIWPTLALAVWWVAGRKSPRFAFGGFCSVLLILHCLVSQYRTVYAEEYTHDLEFIQRVKPLATAEQPLFVLGEFDVLNPSWTLFYLEGRGKLLHNETYLRDDRITTPEILIICREKYHGSLEPYGTSEILDQSERARYERSPSDRYTLYRLTFHQDLMRVPANVRMTPLQATGRDAGPYLGKSIETARTH